MPIPGTTKLHRLEENLGVASVTLEAEGQKAMEGTLAAIAVQSGRTR